MLSISLGPIAVPVAPMLLLLAVWGASWFASRLASRQGQGANLGATASAAGTAVLGAAGFGLLAARLAHLALYADLYLASPGSTLDVRDGGWHAPAGVAAGMAWLAWRSLRAPLLRRPLAGAALAGSVFWLLATMAIGTRDSPPMPASVLLTALDSGMPTDLRRAAAGRPVVVNLWASWCGPCQEEMPVLATAQRLEPDIGFLFINQGEADAAVRGYLARMGLPLHSVLLDARSELGPAVGSQGLPTTLFYDARGRLIDAHFGVLNAPALASRLRTLRTAR